MGSDTGESLQDLLEETMRPRRRGPRCGMAALDGLAAEYLRAIEEMWASGTGPAYSDVRRVLHERLGVRVAYDTVRRHIRGECSCRR